MNIEKVNYLIKWRDYYMEEVSDDNYQRLYSEWTSFYCENEEELAQAKHYIQALHLTEEKDYEYQIFKVYPELIEKGEIN